MTLVARFVFRLHTLVLVAQRRNAPDDEAAASASKRLTTIIMVLPVVAGLVVLVIMLQSLIAERYKQPILIVVALVSVFGVGWYTDRVFDRNQPAIEERAAEIREDPNRGANWALRRLFGLWLATWGSTALILVAVRWALIQSGVVEGPLFQM